MEFDQIRQLPHDDAWPQPQECKAPERRETDDDEVPFPITPPQMPWPRVFPSL